MDLAFTVGVTAGALTTISFIPQLLKVYRTKSAEDLSWGMLGVFCLGVGAWLAYGILHGDTPIILANTLTLGLNLVIAFLKIRYENR